jgi:hypothetical protein
VGSNLFGILVEIDFVARLASNPVLDRIPYALS